MKYGNSYFVSLMRDLMFLSLLTVFMISIACARSAEPPVAPLALNTSAPTPAPTATPDDAQRITLADAKKAFDDGSAFFVDARAAEAYEMEHIKGAVNITPATLGAHLKELPKNKKIIVYCS
jgi:hypothetical protein